MSDEQPTSSSVRSAKQGDEGTESTRPKTSAWKSRLIVGVVLVGLLVGGYFGYRYFQNANRKQQPGGTRQVTVTVATAEEESWSRQIPAVGTLEAQNGVDVTNALGGKVVSLDFESGESIKQDDLLVQLDDSNEQADLESIEVRLEQAEREQSRRAKLLAQEATTQERYEQSVATVEDLKAQAAALRATIEKKKITAPFSGLLGIRQIDLGAFLEPGTAIVTLQQLDPILVNFDLPEQQIGALKQGLPVSVTIDAYPDETFPGEVNAITPLIEESTRSVTIQATIQNPELLLRPGMFADVTVRLPEERQVVTVPETAISFSAYGSLVFVVADETSNEASEESPSSKESTGSKLIARQSFVKTGEQRGLKIEVTEGITAGDRIVTSGQMKLEDGSPVKTSEEDVSRDASERPTRP